ncbi:TetR family transcriptional regulator [Allostella vacuolata]|nr:TetR family transcriptional regulator [Stella vacuolata]
MRGATGRPNQKSRTRKDLLEAAARLGKLGRRPSLEEIAEEALVSRATAYRYFPNVEALLVEASFHIAIPQAEDLFGDEAGGDPVARMQRVDTVLHDVVLANEPQLRMMLVHALQQAMREHPRGEAPVRQNRRMPLIEAALEPARERLDARTLATLSRALALIVGPEGFVVGKDVLQLDDAEARQVKHWAIRALIEAAMAEAHAPPAPRKSSRSARPARPPG